MELEKLYWLWNAIFDLSSGRTPSFQKTSERRHQISCPFKTVILNRLMSSPLVRSSFHHKPGLNIPSTLTSFHKESEKPTTRDGRGWVGGKPSKFMTLTHQTPSTKYFQFPIRSFRPWLSSSSFQCFLATLKTVTYLGLSLWLIYSSYIVHSWWCILLWFQHYLHV